MFMQFIGRSEQFTKEVLLSFKGLQLRILCKCGFSVVKQAAG